MSFTFDKTKFAPDDVANCLLGGGGDSWYSNTTTPFTKVTDNWGQNGNYTYCLQTGLKDGNMTWNCDQAEARISIAKGDFNGHGYCSNNSSIKCHDNSLQSFLGSCLSGGSCGSFPCQNGGYCAINPTSNAGECICSDGYTGKSCETAVCYPPCIHGTCWNGHCHCDPGYGGVTCDTQVYCNVGMTPYDGACHPNSYCCAGTPGTDDSYKCGPGKKDLCSVLGVKCDPSNPYAQCGTQTTCHPACVPPQKSATPQQ